MIPISTIYDRLNDRYDSNAMWWLYVTLKCRFEKEEQFMDYDRVKIDMKAMYPRVPLNPCYGTTKTKPTIKKVIFNNPATIIMWNDGSKSVVKCQNGEPFDAEKGFALAYLKKLLGNDNTFNKEIKKWVKYEEPTKEEPTKEVTSKLRFKTGDRAKIIDNQCGHKFEIGTIVTLTAYETDYKATDGYHEWWVADEELTEVKDGKTNKS